MKNVLNLLIIFGVLSQLCSEDLNEDDRGYALATVSTETDDSEGGHVEFIRKELSSEQLSEIHELAKNISHSKGLFREGTEEYEIRRSVLMKATVASESETLKNLVLNFDSAKNKLEVLQQIEYLVHQYDVAVKFSTTGAMKIISAHLFSDDDEIVSAVAVVLGSAMQSNPSVQHRAIQENIGRSLTYLLAHPSPNVVSRIIFAVSSLLRNMPKAQEEFIGLNGFSKFTDILNNMYIPTNTKLKIVDLISDLAIEHMTVTQEESGRNSQEIYTLKLKFFQEILKYNICKNIASFLIFEDYDTHQKTVAAMLALDIVCHKDFKSDVIKNKLLKLIDNYGGYKHYFKQYFVYPDIDDELRAALLENLKFLYGKIKDNSGDATINLTKDEL